MYAGLSLDQAPPFKGPLRFFLTAPLFAIIASLILLFTNTSQNISPSTTILLHYITIGFMIFIIFGALQQMLPVVAGAVVKRPLMVSNITYISLLLGLFSFAIAFYTYNKIFFALSGILFFIGMSLFLVCSLYKLMVVPNKSWIVIGMISSILFAIMGFTLALYMLYSNYTSNITPIYTAIIYIHYNYMFFGFVMLLIVSITFQVVPMFWVGSHFTTISQRIIILSIVFLLFFNTLNLALDLHLDIVYKVFMSCILVYFALLTINKLKNRKRKVKDISVYFYTSSMIFLIIGVIYWNLSSIFKLNIFPLAIIFGLGFSFTLMNGMLYKIVPFLTWFHLSNKGIFDIPNMRDMIKIKHSQLQFNSYIFSVVLFLVGYTISSDYLIKYGAIIFIISNILFYINIYNSAKIYLKRL